MPILTLASFRMKRSVAHWLRFRDGIFRSIHRKSFLNKLLCSIEPAANWVRFTQPGSSLRSIGFVWPNLVAHWPPGSRPGCSERTEPLSATARPPSRGANEGGILQGSRVCAAVCGPGVLIDHQLPIFKPLQICCLHIIYSRIVRVKGKGAHPVFAYFFRDKDSGLRREFIALRPPAGGYADAYL